MNECYPIEKIRDRFYYSELIFLNLVPVLFRSDLGMIEEDVSLMISFWGRVQTL